ncbi:hypothetical protein OUZ56_018766 [Daphnia magna]|uniref:Uncharacterized protein n=1 Tax=Daphnia magna TaxID=35525 RepID=A0ABQ9Z9X4_9CRUS|nr:hypothetical protein OUZ56_018766 [Daphnia magna]
MPSITIQQSPMVVKTVLKVTSPTSDGIQANSLRFPTADFLLPNGSPASPEVVEGLCSSTSCPNMKYTNLHTLLEETWLDDLNRLLVQDQNPTSARVISNLSRQTLSLSAMPILNMYFGRTPVSSVFRD